MLAEQTSQSTVRLDRPRFGSRIRVLVVDDSTFIRNYLSNRLDGFRRIHVVGAASDGVEALDMARELDPDVVALDIHMPRLNGLETLDALMKNHPTRVLMLSNLTIADSEATIEALHRGALDVVAKPRTERPITEDFIADIVDKIEVLATRPLQIPIMAPTRQPTRPRPARSLPLNDPNFLVIIGSSTGGPAALNEIIPVLPADLDVAYLIVQHMPPNFTRALAQRLNRTSDLLVKEAENGDPLRTGMALVAPGEFHVLLDEERRIVLNRGYRIGGARPSVDITMEHIAPMYGSRLCGVVLTGIGIDGRRGARHIRRHQGYVIAQDEATSVVYGMPGSVWRGGYANVEAPLQEIAAEIVKWRSTAR